MNDENFEEDVRTDLGDLTAYQTGLKTRQATPEELEKLNLTLGAVRKPTTGQMGNREVQHMVDEQKSKVQTMTELAETGLTLPEVAEKMGIPLATASSIANVSGLSKIFKQNKAKQLGLPVETLEKMAKVVERIAKPKEPTPEPQAVTEESVAENKDDVKGTFEMAEEIVGKKQKTSEKKSLVKDMLWIAQRYNLDFMGGMIVQAILKGDMYEAREYMADVMDGVKA